MTDFTALAQPPLERIVDAIRDRICQRSMMHDAHLTPRG